VKSKGILATAVLFSLLAGGAVADEKRFGTIMDSVFGPGSWRMTGGYRTPERENELRAQGALTVPPGVLSRHSTGRPGAPGAYDLVVDGMSPARAAAKLRRAGAPFRKYFPEGRHGTQGAHLHLEPHSFSLDGAGPLTRTLPSVYAVVDPTPAERAFARLHAEASEDDADAQLLVGQAYAQGRATPRDLVAAFVWTALAASNDAAEPATRSEAEQTLSVLVANMTEAQIARARRFARSGGGGANSERCASAPVGIVLRVSGRTAEPHGGCGLAATAAAPSEIATGR